MINNDEKLYSLIVNDFNNRYVKENKLDIDLELHMFTEQNTTFGKDFYSSTVDTLLNKQSHKYDVFIYDPLYTRRYAPYFLDLQKYLPKDLMNQYSSGEALKSGYYNGKWISLPIYIKYKLLYSNINYLTKYNKTIPETWDELIETTQYIIEHEHTENNFNIIGYSGLFPKNDITMCSLYEYLYSFREKENDGIPEFNSQRALDAIKKFNILKNTTTSNEVLTSDENYAAGLLFGGVTLFSSYFDINNMTPDYYASEMPGDIKGIHGSCLTGYNIGVPEFLNDNDKKNASIEVVKYFLSEYVQKEFFVKVFNCFTAMKSLYEDEEVCQILDCELAKKIQSISRPSLLIEDYDSYSNKVVDFFYEILSNNRPIKDILIDIDNLTRIHNFSINSTLGLIIFILLLITFSIVVLSTILLFIPKFKKNFSFLNLDSWIFYTFGFIIIIFSEILNFGELTIEKCNLNTILFSLGFTFIYIPILQKLISHIPLNNPLSHWISKNRILFVYSLIFIEILYNLLYLFSPYTLKNSITQDNNNHGICKLKNSLGQLLVALQIGINGILYLCIIILIFLEWNMENIYNEIRALTATIAMGAVSLILLMILKFRDISNFRIIYLCHSIITIIYVITNHSYLFFIRIISSLIFKDMDEVDRLSHKFFQNNNHEILNTTTLSNISDIRTSLSSEKLSNNALSLEKLEGKSSSYGKLTFKSTKSSKGYNTIINCHFAKSTMENDEN
ncbi:periplasmic binding protein-like II [Anaeromyces robustus]|uniref:Periplasmic binding protein-like II n=1 Tax=Anaeromyces robustus TaxID=1754192 RepID=A0A1Y1WUZ9_9FUNG|nr:periplasmic binding protein-like II [Anaeromyces robustus]|eukprot:ORX77389.1 periplasmic binding protein-like II [Anaeromyces robustus]